MTDKVWPSDISEIIANLGRKVSRFGGRTVLVTGGCGFNRKYFAVLFHRLDVAELNRLSGQPGSAEGALLCAGGVVQR